MCFVWQSVLLEVPLGTYMEFSLTKNRWQLKKKNQDITYNILVIIENSGKLLLLLC